MSELIEDKERHKAWVQYIKRPIPPTLDSAFDWAWFRQQREIEKLEVENSELQRKLDLVVDLIKEAIDDLKSFERECDVDEEDEGHQYYIDALKEIGEER